MTLAEGPGSRDSCVFCAIVSGDAEASVVYADEDVLAFLDILPVTSGHLLVIPRGHAPRLADVPSTTAGHLFMVGQLLAAALRRSGLPCDGITMLLADGEAALQEVDHVHLHVFPRTPADGFRIDAAWRPRERSELEDAASRIRAGLPLP